MISNEHPSANGHSRYHERARYYKQHPTEETLKVEKIQIERKTFIFTLKENPRGRFVRITEDVGGRRDMVIIPVTGLEDFKRILEEMAKASREIPSRSTTAQQQQTLQPPSTDGTTSEEQKSSNPPTT